MTVIITKLTRSGKPRTITGLLLQDGISHVTVRIGSKDGSQSIKRFDKSKHIIRIVGEE